MKSRNLVVLLISLSITAGASLLPQGGNPKTAEKKHDEQLAENVYKNIQVMKGTPSGEIVPAMRFICDSLRVSCSYCHAGGDFASDAKQEKKTARHMIEMQRDINLKDFGGRTQVTCNTCHKGSTNPQGSPVVMDVSRRSPKLDGSPIEVSAVLKKFSSAAGSGLKSVVLEGTTTNQGPETPLKITQGAPNKFVMEAFGSKFVFDGTAVWANGSKLSGTEAFQVQSLGRFFWGEHAFDSVGELRYAGRDTLNGEDVLVLRTTGRGTVSEDFYFDEKSGLLVRIGTYTTTVLGRGQSITDFSDYRRVGGTLIPFLITLSTTRRPGVTKFTKATPNPQVSDSFFSMPAGGAAGGTAK